MSGTAREGILIKGIGGFYYVLTGDGRTVECKARGRFRIDGLTPMVGDRVTIRIQSTGAASLCAIHPRKNALLRPSVANIDRLFIAVSASVPHPDWLLVDRLIIMARSAGITPIPVLNKMDAADPEIVAAFDADYAACFPAIRISCVTGEGLDALREAIRGHICCFAGQSAVGKSSLLNALIPALALQTGELSKKTDRGKHTTRHAQLWPYAGGAVLDTPGFSFLETEALTQAQLDQSYPEFGDAPSRCRFAGCAHVAEPDCAVKALVAEHRMSRARYARYCLLAGEMTERRKHRYD